MDIVRHEPGILPGVALAVVIVAVLGRQRVKFSQVTEITFRVLATHEVRILVKIVAIGLAALIEILEVFLVADILCHASDAPVGKGIFQAPCHGLFVRLQVVWDVSVLLQQAH